MERLFSFPEARTPPESILAELRAIDDRVDLTWLGLYGFAGKKPRNGEDTTIYKPAWMVGRVYDDPEQRRQAADGLELFGHAPVERKHLGRIRLWHLKYQGFHPTLIYPSGVLDGGLINDFQCFAWIRRHIHDIAIARAIYEADDERDLERRIEVIHDLNATNARDVWRYVWKGRRSILVN